MANPLTGSFRHELQEAMKNLAKKFCEERFRAAGHVFHSFAVGRQVLLGFAGVIEIVLGAIFDRGFNIVAQFASVIGPLLAEFVADLIVIGTEDQ